MAPARNVEGARRAWMAEALELARRGLESVSPNPMVGALLVRSGRVLARGYHRRPGGPHAEVAVLSAARRAGVDPRGADLYVTLEPCAHHGKTPPCVDAILAAGLKRVFYAVDDPNPVTRGIGPRILRHRGVEVSRGLLAAEAHALNEPFFQWITTGIPWVILKWAMTLDGRTAAPLGTSRWITGEEARAHAHGLRRRVDAVLVGTETALRDDPLLTPRPAAGRTPWRIVLDRRSRLPLSLKLLSPDPEVAGEGPRALVAGAGISPRRRRELEKRGVHVLVAKERRGALDLRSLLVQLASFPISQVLVEGGSRLHGGFLRARLAREIAAYVAPRLLGSEEAPGAITGSEILRLQETPWLSGLKVQPLGRDLLIAGRLAPEPG